MSTKSHISGKAKAIAWLCTLVYFGSYMTRKNFDVMLLYVIGDFSAASGIAFDPLKIQLAVIVTGMTITYGIGQVVCGFIGDKIKPEYMLTGGLALASITNILMAIPGVASADHIALMTAIWAVNGFAHSMLWPPMVRIMSMYLNDDEYGYTAVRVSWGSQFATILLYLGCPSLCELGLDWRWVILICAGMGIVINICWNLFYPRLLKDPIKEPVKKSGSKKGGVPIPAFVIIPLICIFFGIVSQGIMRDGVTTWAPTLLDETFNLGTAASTVSTVVLAIFSIISFSAYDLVHRKLFKNEVFCSAVIFAFSAVLSTVVLLTFIFNINSAVLSIFLMAVIVANMHGINLMLITVVPKRFIKSGKVSLFSGVLNACTYVGSAIGTPVFAALSGMGYGWTPVVISWVGISIVGLCVTLIASPLWAKFRRDYSDNDNLILEETPAEAIAEKIEQDS